MWRTVEQHLTGFQVKTTLCFFVCLFAVLPRNTYAQEVHEVGINADGHHGIHRLNLPYAPRRHITISGQGGYGLTESVGDIDGAHHRLYGKAAVGGSLLKWLGFGLSLEGYLDNHPDDEEGADSTLIGKPHLNLRAGHALTKMIQLGADFDLWIPGAKAPSLKGSASTLNSRLLFALSPEGEFWTVAAALGFRLDNSANAAPPNDTMRTGDRISLGMSEYNAVLLGLGSSLRFSSMELLLELTADVLVGDGAPTGSSPLRVAVGGRYHIFDGLAAELMTESHVAKRPPLDTDDPLSPVEPRFSLLAGLRYSFLIDKPAPPPDTDPLIEDKPPLDEPQKPPAEPVVELTRLEGRVVNTENNPIGGAVVRIAAGDKELETTTTPEGAYAFDGVPVGPATLTVITEGFDEDTRELTVTKGMPPVEPHILKEIESSQASQLRGVIRSIDGKQLRASILIKPGNIELETDDSGYFTQDLAPGRYTVLIKCKGYKRQTRKVEIEENSVTILNADLRKR